jgi:peptidoglycan/xylan/chitin deacetylase (PgdA/CDA1 family)
VLDLATGCYPAFLFGGSTGALLPVFHFHDVTREWLEPRLQFLVENGYRTVAADEIAHLVVDGIDLGPKRVALTFDDAWASVHSVVLPLLRQYGLSIVLFAIPGRIGDAPGETPFVTWTQLRELHASGVVDIQSHTRSHAMIFGGDEVVDFVRPGFEQEPMLNRPVRAMNGHVDTVPPDALGTPLYVRRSRMSDARQYHADEAVAERCRAHVAANGGAAFFNRPTWRSDLTAIASGASGRFEDDETRAAVIRKELAEAREWLNSALGTTTVRHVALPWGVSGRVARAAIEATGHVTAFAERPLRRRAVAAGDDRFQLMRLSGRFLTCLPGRGRTSFFSAV